MTTYIVCNNRRVFEGVCRDEGLNPRARDVVYVVPGALLGRRFDPAVDRIIERYVEGRVTEAERKVHEELVRFRALV